MLILQKLEKDNNKREKQNLHLLKHRYNILVFISLM